MRPSLQNWSKVTDVTKMVTTKKEEDLVEVQPLLPGGRNWGKISRKLADKKKSEILPNFLFALILCGTEFLHLNNKTHIINNKQNSKRTSSLMIWLHSLLFSKPNIFFVFNRLLQALYATFIQKLAHLLKFFQINNSKILPETVSFNKTIFFKVQIFKL